MHVTHNSLHANVFIMYMCRSLRYLRAHLKGSNISLARPFHYLTRWFFLEQVCTQQIIPVFSDPYNPCLAFFISWNPLRLCILYFFIEMYIMSGSIICTKCHPHSAQHFWINSSLNRIPGCELARIVSFNWNRFTVNRNRLEPRSISFVLIFLSMIHALSWFAFHYSSRGLSCVLFIFEKNLFIVFSLCCALMFSWHFWRFKVAQPWVESFHCCWTVWNMLRIYSYKQKY